jgi:hypothetical protein
MAGRFVQANVTVVLISPEPDQEGKKLQRQKILMFIYSIYYHNWRNISTIYTYNKTSIKRNILTIKQNTSRSRSGQGLISTPIKILCLLHTEYFKRKERILSKMARFPIFFKHLYFLFSPLGSSFYFSTSSLHTIFFSLFTLNFISISYKLCDMWILFTAFRMWYLP